MPLSLHGCDDMQKGCCLMERSALKIAIKVKTREWQVLGTARCFARWQLRVLFQRALDQLKRVVQQRTVCLDTLRTAYIKDVLAVKLCLQQQKEIGAEVVGVHMPEEVARAPSAELRGLLRDVQEHSEVELLTRVDGELHRVGVDPSKRGVREFPCLLESGEARVDDLSLGVYAPSSHALVIKPCEACLGIASFIIRRNRRVDDALKRQYSAERAEEEKAALKKTNMRLLDRALCAEARLTKVVDQLEEARGSGKNGRDWLVKEISRMGQEASAFQAGDRGRQQALFEAHRQMEQERVQHRQEAEEATKVCRYQLGAIEAETEFLREALAQSNAEVRSENRRADELNKEALSLRETVKRVKEDLEEEKRLATVATGRVNAADGEIRALRQTLLEARDRALGEGLEAGDRLEGASLALQKEEEDNRDLRAQLDEANATVFALRQDVAAAEADALEASRQHCEEEAETSYASGSSTESAGVPESRDVQIVGEAAVSGVSLGRGTSSFFRLAARACAVGVGRGREAAERRAGRTIAAAASEAEQQAADKVAAANASVEAAIKAKAEEEIAAAAAAAAAAQLRDLTAGLEEIRKAMVDSEEAMVERGAAPARREKARAGVAGVVWRVVGVTRELRERLGSAEARLRAAEMELDARAEEARQERSRGKERADAFARLVARLRLEAIDLVSIALGNNDDDIDDGDDLSGDASISSFPASQRLSPLRVDSSSSSSTACSAPCSRQAVSVPAVADAAAAVVNAKDPDLGSHIGVHDTLAVAVGKAAPEGGKRGGDGCSTRYVGGSDDGGHVDAVERGHAGEGLDAGGPASALGLGLGWKNGGEFSFATTATSAVDGPDADEVVDIVGREAKSLAAVLVSTRDGVRRLRAKLAASIKRSRVERVTREAERVRVVKLVTSLKADLEELRRRPPRRESRDANVQTLLTDQDKSNDKEEVFTRRLAVQKKAAARALEELREDAEREQQQAGLDAEEVVLDAEERLNSSHIRETQTRSYCRRLECRVRTLKGERDFLRQERQTLRVAVHDAFKDTAAKDKERAGRQRNASTQVRCCVCAMRGELGAGDTGGVLLAGKAWRWSHLPKNVRRRRGVPSKIADESVAIGGGALLSEIRDKQEEEGRGPSGWRRSDQLTVSEHGQDIDMDLSSWPSRSSSGYLVHAGLGDVTKNLSRSFRPAPEDVDIAASTVEIVAAKVQRKRFEIIRSAEAPKLTSTSVKLPGFDGRQPSASHASRIANRQRKRPASAGQIKISTVTSSTNLNPWVHALTNQGHGGPENAQASGGMSDTYVGDVVRATTSKKTITSVPMGVSKVEVVRRERSGLKFFTSVGGKYGVEDFANVGAESTRRKYVSPSSLAGARLDERLALALLHAKGGGGGGGGGVDEGNEVAGA